MTAPDPRREAVAKFIQYRRKQIAELRPWITGDDMASISVSPADSDAGSPKPGDMIARNPKNHKDQWLVAAAYFADNFEDDAALAAIPPDIGDSADCAPLGDTVGERIMSSLGYDLQRGFVVRIVNAINAIPPGDAEKMREDAAKLCDQEEGSWPKDHSIANMFARLSSAIRALPVTPRPMGGWQPIETAPKDKLIEVYAPSVQELNSLVSLCQYHEDAGFCICELRSPTHWRPHEPPEPMLDLINRTEADAAPAETAEEPETQPTDEDLSPIEGAFKLFFSVQSFMQGRSGQEAMQQAIDYYNARLAAAKPSSGEADAEGPCSQPCPYPMPMDPFIDVYAEQRCKSCSNNGRAGLPENWLATEIKASAASPAKTDDDDAAWLNAANAAWDDMYDGSNRRLSLHAAVQAADLARFGCDPGEKIAQLQEELATAITNAYDHRKDLEVRFAELEAELKAMRDMRAEIAASPPSVDALGLLDELAKVYFAANTSDSFSTLSMKERYEKARAALQLKGSEG